MTRAFVALGANLGDRAETIRLTIQQLENFGTIVRESGLYETEPVGYLDQPTFFNAVVEIETELAAENLLDHLLEIEAELGRVRTFQNAPRTIDLDLLLYGSEIIEVERLIVPHPRMLERAFVLVPLAEIAADFVHPVTGRTIRDHLNDLGPITGIERVATM